VRPDRSDCGFRNTVIKAHQQKTILKAGIDNEEEGYGRNAGVKLHYYRIAIPMTEIWPDYVGSPRDGLRIEVFETWLERI
jgi:nitrile hydratase subunit beta